VTEHPEDERVSMYGLVPEEALRALLAVDPDAPRVKAENESGDDGSLDEQPRSQ